MPIMVTNTVKATPETITKIKEKYCEGGYFNLEKITPMPPILDFADGSETVTAILYAIYLKSDEELNNIQKNMKQKNVDIDFISNYVFKKGMDLIAIKQSLTKDDIERIKYNAERYIPWLGEEKLGVKTLDDLGNLCLNNMLEYNAISRSRWCSANWGTYGAWVNESRKEDILSVDSEWNPPIQIFQKLSKEFSNDTFYIEYEDNAGYMKGNLTIKNGEILEEYSMEADDEEELEY